MDLLGSTRQLDPDGVVLVDAGDHDLGIDPVDLLVTVEADQLSLAKFPPGVGGGAGDLLDRIGGAAVGQGEGGPHGRRRRHAGRTADDLAGPTVDGSRQHVRRHRVGLEGGESALTASARCAQPAHDGQRKERSNASHLSPAPTTCPHQATT